jgi:hypothetical protein
VGERKILLLARIDAPAVEGNAILLRESLHFCFGSADVVVVKRERAHADLAQLQQLRTEMLAAGLQRAYGADRPHAHRRAEKCELYRVGLTSL